MANFLNSAANKIRNTSFIIPAYLIFVVMLIVGLVLGYEDYSTNRVGYERFPTEKVNLWVIPVVALVPQIGQLGLFLVFLFDTNKRWGLLIASFLFLIDLMFDVWFKTKGLTLGFQTFIFAVIESVGIYTIGSEIMASVALGMCIDLAPDFLRKSGELLSSLFDSVAGNGTGRSNSSAPAPPAFESSRAGGAPNSSSSGKPSGFPEAQMRSAASDEERKEILRKWREGRSHGDN